MNDTFHNGFTLLEIVLVMSLFLIIASTSTVIGLQSFKRSSVRSEERLIVSVLQKARSEAMNASCLEACGDDAAHGVHIDRANITLFEGTMFSPNEKNNESFAHLSNTDESGLTDIVFKNSGETLLDPSATNTIILSDPSSKDLSISVESDGQISWSN